MAKINIRESLGKRDLISDNKYDLRNTYDSLNLSENKKKQLAKALYENKSNEVIYSILNTDESFSKHSRRHRLMLESEGKYFGLMYYEPDSGENGMEADKFYLSDCGEFNSIEEARAFWRKYLLRDKGRAFVSEITKAEYEDWLAESELEKEWEASYNQTYGTNLYDESLNRHQLLENAYIKQFSRYSEEYEKLDRVSTFLTAMSPNKYYYYVGNTYFDLGQDWKWTTILAKTLKGNSYQALNPRQQEDILLARSDEELEEIAKQILKNAYVDKGFAQESFSTKADLFKSMNRSHELDEAAFSGGMAGDSSASGGTIRGRGASTQPDKKSYLGRLKNKNPDLVDVITVKGKDIKRGMITQSGQVKEAEVKRNNRGETKVYIMHTNNYDGLWDADEDMEVLADPENKSKPFTGDYRALLKMGLKESASLVNEDIDTEDFDDDYSEDGVEEGNRFFADGKDYTWEEKIAGPIHLDFDNWAVWSARESVNIFDYATEKPGGGYKVDKDAFMKAYMAAPVVYFVVDEDTGFIDWGPCDTDIEAKDFLNSKQDDWEDDYFVESINSSTTYNIDDYSPKAMVDEITAKVKDPNVSFIKLYYKSRYGNGCTCFKRNGNSWSWVNDKGLVMNHGTVNEKNSLNLSDQYVVKQLIYSLRNNNCTKLIIDIRASADL